MPLGVEPQRLNNSVHGMDVRAANFPTLPLVIEQLVSAEDDEAKRGVRGDESAGSRARDLRLIRPRMARSYLDQLITSQRLSFLRRCAGRIQRG
jgi:hypothetical protein